MRAVPYEQAIADSRRQYAERAANLQRRSDAIVTVDDCATSVRPQYGAQDAQRRRLAGAVVTEQAGDAAVLRFERDIVQRLYGAELLAEALDANHGAGALRDNMKAVGRMLRTQ